MGKRFAGVLALACVLLAIASASHSDGLTTREIGLLNRMNTAAQQVKLGTKLNEALTGTPELYSTYSLFWAGNVGHDVGPGADGVLFGALKKKKK